MSIKAKLYDYFGNYIWAVGYRKLEKFEDNLVQKGYGSFRLLKTDKTKWAADPIIREICGQKYLFVELYDTLKEKGEIAVSKYNLDKDCFEPFVTVISEAFHLSFPEIFEYRGEYYMLPESHEVSQFRFYKMVKSPYEWELIEVVDTSFAFSDTVVLNKNGIIYLLTTEKPDFNPFLSRIHLFMIDNFHERHALNMREIYVGDDYTYSDRNGGSILSKKNRQIRVIQNADERWYGKELAFRYILKISDEEYIEGKDFRVIKSDDIKCNPLQFARVLGTHSYGIEDNIEVVDVYLQCITLKTILSKVIGRLNCKSKFRVHD